MLLGWKRLSFGLKVYIKHLPIKNVQLIKLKTDKNLVSGPRLSVSTAWFLTATGSVNFKRLLKWHKKKSVLNTAFWHDILALLQN